MQEIGKNLIYYKKLLKFNQKLCFVAKANCYGLGDKLCKFFNNYVDYFAVSSVYEYKRIKRYITKPVLILDTIYDKKSLKYLIKNKCEITISNLKSLNIIVELSKKINEKINIHIAINTGMNRLGFKDNNEVNKCIKILKKTQNIEIKGIFSHYFKANNLKFDIFQLNIFNEIITLFKENKMNLPIIHICATDGVKYKNYGDMVRIGFGLYNNDSNETITLKTKIIEIQILKDKEVAGYDGIFVSNGYNTKIAVVGIGYGDGLLRNIVNKGFVLIHDKFVKIVAICMDMMLVDISEVDCKIDDDVIIIGKSNKNKISICDIARWCDTIGYEIIVRLSNRIKRKYIGENLCKSSLENIELENF